MTSRQATAFIDLEAVSHNFNRAAELAPASKVMAVVKAEAYGHGAVRVARKLDRADALAVARVSEAVALREAGIGKPICLLEGVMDREELALAGIYELQVVVHSDYQLDLMASAAARREVWLKVDTGMNRLGIAVAGLGDAVTKLGRQRLLGLMTHLADAGEPGSGLTQKQIRRLQAASERINNPAARRLSIANSAGILAHPDSRTAWVRPGLMLYGASPMNDLTPVIELQPAMTFSAPVISVRRVKRGESVGYGGIWTAGEDTRLAVVAAGYADGYPRETSPGTPVLINGQRRRLAGRVSMDMLCVALASDDPVRAGDRAILWGAGLPVEEIAQHAATLPYTLLTGVSRRVLRSWRGEVGHG